MIIVENFRDADDVKFSNGIKILRGFWSKTLVGVNFDEKAIAIFVAGNFGDIIKMKKTVIYSGSEQMFIHRYIFTFKEKV